jgi:3',5'-cyclic AMP phosphodiesterase CpdA
MKRSVVAVLALACVPAALPSCGSSAGGRVTGRVFEDANGNHRRDAGERGVGGVLVSSQIDVVETDEDGRYALKISDEGTVVFVVKPPGYDVPIGEDELPHFYYIYQPGGSPRSQFDGVAPTGPIPESLDFPLIPSTRRDAFDVVVFADPQPRSQEEVGYIRDDVVAELVGVDAAFGITLGDIMYDDLSLFERYNRVVAGIGIPFYNVPGNHDMNYDAPDDRNSLETYKRHFGPSYYAFEYGNVSFIVLDTVEWLGRNGEGDTGTGHYRGRLGDRQLQWMKRYLRRVPRDRLLVLAMHIPLYCARSDDDHVYVVDRDRLFGLLDGRRVLAIAGHMHVFEHDVLDRSVGWGGVSPFVQVTCAAVSGSWWSGPEDARGIPTTDQRDGTPNGYHLFHFDTEGWEQRYKAAGRAGDYQMRISSPSGTVPVSALDTTSVVVNVFAGSEQWKVEVSLDGGPARPMTRKVRTDPYFERLLAQFPDSFDQGIEPVPSGHIWTAPLPAGLVPGTHHLSVTAKDPRNRVFTASSLFRLE